jgi:hypothetical protein
VRIFLVMKVRGLLLLTQSRKNLLLLRVTSYAICSLVLVVASGFTPAANCQPYAQKETPASGTSTLCDSANAVSLIREQIQISKTFDNTIPRISVLIRAADLLWKQRETEARNAFAEALEIAKRDYKERGDKPTREGRLAISGVDQRYRVISAIAKRDPGWARQITVQLFEEATKDAESNNGNTAEQSDNGDKLLNVASSLLPSDPNTAASFARLSFKYPASIGLPSFLYKLAETNRAAADQVYQDALISYATSPLDELLYLSAYPFAMDRDLGEMPTSMHYQVPGSFQPISSLQTAFVQTLSKRAQLLSANPEEARIGTRMPAAVQLWLVFTRLESLGQRVSPSALQIVAPAKGLIINLLSNKDRQRVDRLLLPPPSQSLDEQVEAAEKQSKPEMREQMLAFAVLHADESEDLDRLIKIGDKIDDIGLRQQIVSFVYFTRAQSLIKQHKTDEARGLASKVEELDNRAYLYSAIATEIMKQMKDDSEARVLLEEVATAAGKAPDTEIKVRVLFSVSHLFAGIEPSRSIALLGDAVKAINRIEGKDFSRDFVIKRIEGKSFGSYVTLQMPGFNPENAFREVSRYDFDGTLYQTANFNDKLLRAMTTMAMADLCLQQKTRTPKLDKPTKKKP